MRFGKLALLFIVLLISACAGKKQETVVIQQEEFPPAVDYELTNNLIELIYQYNDACADIAFSQSREMAKLAGKKDINLNETTYDIMYNAYVADEAEYQELKQKFTSTLQRYFNFKRVADRNKVDTLRSELDEIKIEIDVLINYCNIVQANKKIDRAEKLLNM